MVRSRQIVAGLWLATLIAALAPVAARAADAAKEEKKEKKKEEQKEEEAVAEGEEEAVAAASSGLKVAKVQFRGNRKVEDDAIKVNLKTASGVSLTQELLREDMHAIWKMGFFEDIQVEDTR